MSSVVVASYNVHGGVDGFGRPFDVVDACRGLDADVLVLQESWSPDDAPSLARVVGEALGYQVEELAMARGRMWTPPPGTITTASWGPLLRAHGPYGIRLNGRSRPRAARSQPPVGTSHSGTWGIAVLSRLPVRQASTLSLGRLLRDPAERGAIVVDLDLSGRTLKVVGTHLAHVSNGSVLHLRVLRDLIIDPVTPSVLAGDMNLWGPPLSALLPGWSRVVRGRTWPAWRPLAQLDHILVTAGVEVDGGAEVVAVGGSDHLPVRASLAF